MKATEGSPIRSSFTIAAIAALTLLMVLELTLVYPAVIPIAKAFHTTEVGWVVTIPLLVGAIVAPLIGKVADLFGKKQIVLLVTLLFLIGSLLCATAANVPILLVGRALQGAGLALPALMYAILHDALPERLVPIGVGTLGVILGLSFAVGPALSGLLLNNFGFRGVFWFCAIYIILSAGFFAIAVQDSGYRARRRLDLLGNALFGCGIGLIILVLEEGGTWGWLAGGTIAALVIGLALLAAFVWRSLRIAEPTINLRVLASPTLRTPIVTGGLGYLATGVFALLLPMMLETPASAGPGYGLGVSAIGITVFYLPYGLIGAAVGQLSGVLLRRGWSVSLLRICTGALVVGMVCMALLHAHPWQVLLSAGVLGIGYGLIAPTTGFLTANRAPHDQRGIATSVLGQSQDVGGALATPVAIAVLTANVALVNSSGEVLYSNAGFRWAFLTAGLIALICFGLTFTGRIRDRALDSDSVLETAAASVD
jgi:MFS family permease